MVIGEEVIEAPGKEVREGEVRDRTSDIGSRGSALSSSFNLS